MTEGNALGFRCLKIVVLKARFNLNDHPNSHFQGSMVLASRWVFRANVLLKPICMEKSALSLEKKAGGLKAISRSVTEGNHRKQAKNNSRALEARSEYKASPRLESYEPLHAEDPWGWRRAKESRRLEGH